MKHSISIKNALCLGTLLLAGFSAQTVGAFTYTNSQLLLVFRQSAFNDVEFNLGSVSNFLGKANGTIISVTNWSLALVKANFNNSLANVKFVLVAVTENSDPTKRAWMTDGDSLDAPTDILQSHWSVLYSKISAVGSQATAATFSDPASQAYVTNATDASSYTFIAIGGSSDPGADPSTLNGASAFPIEGTIPATNRFVELKTSTANPKPNSTIVGTFALTTAGALTFTAGTQTVITAPQIRSISRVGTQNTITFSTMSGANYRLHYTNALNSAHISTWPSLLTTVAGDGTNKMLTDTTNDPQRFYAVEAF